MYRGQSEDAAMRCFAGFEIGWGGEYTSLE